jgi:hypothetical protein
MTGKNTEQRDLDGGVDDQQPPLCIEYNAVLEYEDESVVPANPKQAMRRLIREEPEFGQVTVERGGE